VYTNDHDRSPAEDPDWEISSQESREDGGLARAADGESTLPALEAAA
jgi:hypothetical protein